MNKVKVQIVAAVVVAVFAVGIIVSGGKVNVQWLRFYSLAVFIAIILLTAWDRFLWHVGPVQRINAVPRDIRGTWRGTLTSNWTAPGSHEPVAPKIAYLVVRQTSTTVAIILLTDESRSASSLARVFVSDNLATLDYMYLNRPEARVEPRSRMHHGSTSLDISGRPATRLKGRYWTDRQTQGELDLQHRSRRLADDYDSAVGLFGAHSATTGPE